MNTFQIAGWYGGVLVASVRRNTGVEILEQAVRAPATVLKHVGQSVKADAIRIKNAGVWGGVIGATVALVAVPYAGAFVPMALAARGANACESTMGAVCTGIIGYSAGVFVAANVLEIAIGWSIFEWCAVAGRLREDAQKIKAREKKKAARAAVAAARN